MQVLFYAGVNDRDKNRLVKAVGDAVPGKTIEFFTHLDSLQERFRSIIEPDSIAVLLAADQKELRKMQTLRKVLPEIYIIMVIPDLKKSTVRLAHLLLPWFICRKEDSYEDMTKVLRKMAWNPPESIN